MIDTELHYPDMAQDVTAQGYIHIDGIGICSVTYCINGDLAVFEGDIILGDLNTMTRMKKMLDGYGNFKLLDQEANAEMTANACIINNVGKWWNKLLIPYQNNNKNNTAAINNAVEYINKWTPVNLIKHAHETDYVSFIDSTGNSSHVGKKGGMQKIRISPSAKQGTVVHEVFHAAGLWHEHSRSDRDKYVTIDLHNLKDPSKAHNFDKHISDGTDISKYDYGSIMHYSEKAFAKPGTKTIIPPPGVSIGQRNKPSECDKLALIYMFRK